MIINYTNLYKSIIKLKNIYSSVDVMKNSIKHKCKHLDLLFIKSSSHDTIIKDYYYHFISKVYIHGVMYIYLLNYVNTIDGMLINYPSNITFLPLFNNIKLGSYIYI